MISADQAPAAQVVPRVVIICTGNICRSPMAQGILSTKLAAQNISHVQVSSMGIHGLENQPATTSAQEVCTAHNIDISAHRSRPLIADELNHATLILTMERVQKEYVKLFFPRVADRLDLITAWPYGKEVNVKDPMNSSLKVYQKSFDLIAFHIDRLFPHLQNLLARRS